MTDIRLVSKGNRDLKPLVEAALANELRFLEAGILQTEQRLKAFETKYQMDTISFLTQYEDDVFEETMDFAEWIGEFRLLTRLHEKVETIRNIQFAN